MSLQQCECGQRYAMGMLRCPGRGCGLVSVLYRPRVKAVLPVVAAAPRVPARKAKVA